MVLDLTNPESLASLRNEWARIVDECSAEAGRILVANKADLVDERKVSFDDLQKVVSSLQTAEVIETSAVTGSGVPELRQAIAELVTCVKVTQAETLPMKSAKAGCC
jgi:selenocysteine-specific translation elongation factor